MPIEIRVARSDDATAACAVLRRSIAELCEADHGNEPKFLNSWLANKTPENVASWIADPGSIVYVAVRDGSIAGVCAMTKNGLITLNYVSPDARFNGVSRALLSVLEDQAKKLGRRQCVLESTKTAQRFYRAAGYRERPGAAPSGDRAMIKDIG